MLNNVTFASPHCLQSDVLGSSTLPLISKWVGTKMDIFPERCRGRGSENLENLKWMVKHETESALKRILMSRLSVKFEKIPPRNLFKS